MTVAEQPFTFSNNAPWTGSYELLRHGVPLPLGGAELRMQLRPKAESDEVVIDLSTENGRILIVNAAQGIWKFNVSQVDSGQVPAGSFVHDMLVKLPDGEIFFAFMGNTQVLQGVTRSYSWRSIS